MALANLGLQSTPTNESNYRQCRPTGCIHSIVAVTRPPFLTTLKKSKRNQGPRLRGGQGEFRRYLAHRAVDLMVRRTWKSVVPPLPNKLLDTRGSSTSTAGAEHDYAKPRFPTDRRLEFRSCATSKTANRCRFRQGFDLVPRKADQQICWSPLGRFRKVGQYKLKE
jgi:hypothetical protein